MIKRNIIGKPNNKFLSHYDAKHSLIHNSLWIDYSPDFVVYPAAKQYDPDDPKGLGRANKRYVYVKGVVDRSAHGHLGASAGTIRATEFLIIGR